MAVWVDYSAGRPGGAALKAAGVNGAIRYVSAGSSGKLITAAEYSDLTIHGIQVLLVYELGTTDALGGYTAGAAHAQAALSTARAYGIPDTVGIAAASDMHLTAAQVPTAVQYVQGFASVLGVARTGAYGFAEMVDAVHAANAAGWYWKCGSAPTTAEAAWVNFWQRNAGTTTQVINGVTCDLNDQINPIAGVDEMSFDLSTLINVPNIDANGNYAGDLTDSNGKVVQAPVSDFLRFGDAFANQAAQQARAANASLAAAMAVINGLTTSTQTPVTAAQIQTMIDDAVAQHLQITGTVSVTGIAAVAQSGGTTSSTPAS